MDSPYLPSIPTDKEFDDLIDALRNEPIEFSLPNWIGDGCTSIAPDAFRKAIEVYCDEHPGVEIKYMDDHHVVLRGRWCAFNPPGECNSQEVGDGV